MRAACGIPPAVVARMRWRPLPVSACGKRMRAIRRNTGEQAVQMGLRAAARMTGRNQSTIHRAMKNGRLSYTLNEAGERQIDVAELERVFGIRSPGADVPMINGASGQAVAPAVQSNAGHAGETAVLERLLADREATIADLRESNRYLRDRIDSLFALLTDRRPWWRRWFR